MSIQTLVGLVILILDPFLLAWLVRKQQGKQARRSAVLFLSQGVIFGMFVQLFLQSV